MKPYYDDGKGIQIFHGDCLEIAPRLNGIEWVIADPPYGMANDTDSNRFSGGMANGVPVKRLACRPHRSVINDEKPFDPSPWLEYPNVILWGANHFAQRLPVGTTLVWVKRHPDLYGSFLSDAEIAWMKGGCGVYCFYKQFPPPVRAIECGGDPCFPKTPHPNQKPLSLMSWCMEMAGVPTEATVLDPYTGSGSTLRAAKDTGRKAIGIEIDERYCEIAARRLSQEVLSFSAPPANVPEAVLL